MKHYLVSIVSALCIFMSGCTGYQYVTVPHFVPVNTEKGNLTLNYSFNTFQAGYSMSNHFSAFVAGHYRKNSGTIFNNSIFENVNDGTFSQTDMHKQIDAGFTYFKALDSKLVFEVACWTGYGIIKYTNSQDLFKDYDFSFNAKKFNFNIQPNLSVKFNDHVDLSFFSNFSTIRYYKMYGTLDMGEKEDLTEYDRYFYNKRSVPLAFCEPGIQFRAGWKNIKLLYSYSKAFDLRNTGIQYRKNNFYFGISLNFNLIKLKD